MQDRNTGVHYRQILERLDRESYTWLVTGAAGFIGSNLVELLLKLDQAGKFRRVRLDAIAGKSPQPILESAANCSLRLDFKSNSVPGSPLKLQFGRVCER